LRQLEAGTRQHWPSFHFGMSRSPENSGYKILLYNIDSMFGHVLLYQQTQARSVIFRNVLYGDGLRVEYIFKSCQSMSEITDSDQCVLPASLGVFLV
jgi:hypothetical protein